MRTKFLVFLFIGVLVIVSGLYIYNEELKHSLLDASYKTLVEVVNQQRTMFVEQMDGKIAVLETVANLAAVTLSQASSEDDILNFLRVSLRNSTFLQLGMAGRDGMMLNSDGATFSVSERTYFKTALLGNPCVSEPIAALRTFVESGSVIAISVPVYAAGSKTKVQAVLIGTYDSKDLSDLFFPSFDALGIAYIVDERGNVIARTFSDRGLVEGNIFASLASGAKFLDFDTLDDIVKKVGELRSGRSLYEIRGETRFARYAPLGINHWYIMSSAPEDVVMDAMKLTKRNTYILSSVIILMVFILFTTVMVAEVKNSKKLYRTAYYNDLTGAPNLAKFKKEANRILRENPARRYVIIRFSVADIGLFNERYGFGTGDKILQCLASVANKHFNTQHETYGNAFGDRYFMLLEMRTENELNMRRDEFTNLIFECTKKFLSEKVRLCSGRYVVDVGDERTLDSMIERAEFAHRAARQSDLMSGNVQYYDDDILKAVMFRKDIEHKMELALADREFKLFLQPKYRLADEVVVGAEALVRWVVNGVPLLYPNDFIPIFEKNGFVTKIDMYMFEETCAFLKRTIASGKLPITISVNFSRLHLNNRKFVAELCEIANRYEVPHEFLEVELTESSVLENEDVLMDVLLRLHREKFTLSIDDFGTGYSSLGLLKDIPVDVVKFDRSFFATARDIERGKQVVRSVIEMAKKLKIHTVAEGVETKEHIDMLREMGCEVVQGYYYAKPIPYEEFKV